MSDPLYVYGDAVVVKEGFHKGLVGIVIDKRNHYEGAAMTSDFAAQDYLVIFTNFGYTHKKWYYDHGLEAFK